MRLNRFIPPILNDIFVKKKKIKDEKYILGNISLDTPPNFGNINFQNSFKLYDRFLPVLAKHVSSDKLIIDVGANIGDTTIAMLQECINPFLSVEPSDIFYNYLLKNINKLSPDDRDRIDVKKALVGTGSIKGVLDHKDWGTATINVVESKQTSHIALDSIVKNVANVILLKTDTDGFDFDVLMSAKKVLDESEPILFWENEVIEEFQKKGYEDLYSLLHKKGYKHIYVFDNFGNLMTVESDFSTVKNINSYIDSMNATACTRTIYYTDILACTDKNIALVGSAIKDYRINWINKKV